MDKKDWDKAKERLYLPLGRVNLVADGYLVTLQKVPVGDMFHNGIEVFVNGKFEGKWLFEDCEERRRFIAQKTVPLMNRKQIAEYNKAPKKVRCVLKELREAKTVVYDVYWTNWNALVKHFEANNRDIHLVEEG